MINYPKTVWSGSHDPLSSPAIISPDMRVESRQILYAVQYIPLAFLLAYKIWQRYDMVCGVTRERALNVAKNVGVTFLYAPYIPGE